MKYGEIKEQINMDFSTPSEDEVVFKGNDIEMSLWSVNKNKQEIFSPSEALVYLTKNEIVCRKKRSVREKETIIGPPGYPYPTILHSTKIKRGWQWFIFKTDDISYVSRTYLLDHLIKVKTDSGEFEVVIGKGKQAKQLISSMKNYIHDE